MTNVWVFGDDVNTDEIIPGRYNVTTDEQELAQHAFYEVCPEFSEQAQTGDIIVAGKNFGCGSSREHAPIAIKGSKVKAVIARSYARIFYRNAINIGLPILEVPDLINVTSDDIIEVSFDTGEVTVNGRKYHASRLPPFIRRIIESGGIVEFLRNHDISELENAP